MSLSQCECQMKKETELEAEESTRCNCNCPPMTIVALPFCSLCDVTGKGKFANFDVDLFKEQVEEKKRTKRQGPSSGWSLSLTKFPLYSCMSQITIKGQVSSSYFLSFLVSVLHLDVSDRTKLKSR